MNEREFDYSEFSKFADSISNWDRLALKSAKKAMPDATDYLLSQVPEYPEETLGRIEPPDGVSWLRTEQQRKWFFAAVRNGDLKGWKWVDATYTIIRHSKPDPRNNRIRHYLDIQWETKEITNPAHPEKVGGARTGNLGRAQNREVISNEETVTGIVGFDDRIAPDAPWVVGSDYPGENEMYQSRIHADTWWQFQGIMNEATPEAWNKFDETFWEEFSRRIENVSK